MLQWKFMQVEVTSFIEMLNITNININYNMNSN